MIRSILLSGTIAAALLAGSASAQEAGGFALGVGASQGAGMPMGFAPSVSPRLLGAPPSRTPTSVASINPARARQATNQQMVARVRGDAGFLAGFQHGQPLSASRQAPPPAVVPNFTFIDAPFIVNTFESDVSVGLGEGNVMAPADDPNAERQDAGAEGREEGTDIPPQDLTGGSLAITVPGFVGSTGGFNLTNVNSAVNMAIGTGNVALQGITAIQR